MTQDHDSDAVVVVLAAGLGTRMRSRLPKVLHPVCGRPMLAWVLDAARKVTRGSPIVVVSPGSEEVRTRFAADAEFAVQQVPRGTADALAAALPHVPDAARELVVLSGDVPLMDPELIRGLVALRRASDAAVALVSVDAEEPAHLGRVERDEQGEVQRIVEARDADPAVLAVSEVNAGLYAFDAPWLRGRLGDIEPSDVTGESYLTALVALARADDRPVAALEVEDDGSLAGINDRTELADAEVEMRLRIAEGHMRAGVTIMDPATAFIDPEVELDQDVVIEPMVILRGATRVGRDTRIRAGSQVFDSLIGERCVVWASVIESSVVEDDASVGPFSHTRSGAHIGRSVELGNFAEVKNSRLGRGTKSHHFSYLGDAVVGEEVNIGAGTVTANYDGRRKHRTTIGSRSFIGSDTILRAPVTVGEGAITGAGAVVTHDVPAGVLVVGVPARVHEPAAIRNAMGDRAPGHAEGPARPAGHAPEETRDAPPRTEGGSPAP